MGPMSSVAWTRALHAALCMVRMWWMYMGLEAKECGMQQKGGQMQHASQELIIGNTQSDTWSSTVMGSKGSHALK